MASARLVVLALFVAGCQSWKLPAVPAGRRAQFYTQQSDGAYKYGYDTAEGLYQVQEADPANEVRGEFGADGGKLQYTAGVGGFVVTAHQKAAARASAPVHPNVSPVRYATLEELNTPPKPVVDTPEVAAAKASFKQAYDAAAAAAEAAPDTDIITGAVPVVQSTVKASYSYSAPAVQATYLAPAPVVAPVAVVSLDASGRVQDTAEVKAAKQAFKQAYDAAAAAAEAAPDTDIITAPVQAPSALYGAPAVTRVQTVQVAQPVVPVVKISKPVEVAHVRSSASEDGSYEFSYETSSSSRHESADAANNVNGNFEFVADDAQRRRVDYKAGAETGFIASGAHLPQPVADTAEVAAAKASFKSAFESAAAAAEAAPDDPIIYSAPAVAAVAQPVYIAPAPQPVVTTTYGAAKPAEIANFRSTSNADGSYEFSYTTSDSSRHESADAANNVNGNFEFVADDAQRRRVDYKAGAETGFIASGAHLPQPVADTAEVAAAKASFKSAFESAAAAAEAAPDDEQVFYASPVYSVPAPAPAPAPVVAVAPVRYATLEELNTPPKPVVDTPEVAAAKASFKQAYDAAAAAAEAAPDTNIITGAVPVVQSTVKTGYSYSAPAVQATYLAPAPVVAPVAVVSLDASGRVQDTAEVKAAKQAFKQAYDVAAAAAEAAPDTDIITAPVAQVKAHAYSGGASHQTKAAQHGDTLTYSFDGITVMQADGASSPAKFGYTYE